MRFRPHDYQTYCIKRMINEDHLGLFLNMGLGKTVITLTALNELIFYQNKVRHALIIAPKRVAETTWSDEASKWDHLKHLSPVKILGSKKERLKAARTESEIYVINRENVSWLAKEFKNNWKWDCVVIDELSSFKNHQSKRFKSLKAMLPKINRVYGLTGTPAANGLIDLWAQLYLLDKGERLEPTIGKYRYKYFKPDKRNAHVIFTYKLLPGSEELIRQKISDICISLKSSDYVKMPKLIKTNTTVELDKETKKHYTDMQKDMLVSLPDGDISAVNAAAVTTKLLQIASGAVYDSEGAVHKVHTEKLEALKEIIEAANGEPVLVFYNYKHERDLVLENIEGSVELKGKDTLNKWNNRQIPVLVAHPASCGYGLNMQQGGRYIVWYSPTWNLEQYEQANARLFRQGQKRQVVINHLLANNTMDFKVLNALKSKDKTQTALLKELERKRSEIVKSKN